MRSLPAPARAALVALAALVIGLAVRRRRAARVVGRTSSPHQGHAGAATPAPQRAPVPAAVDAPHGPEEPSTRGLVDIVRVVDDLLP